MNNETSLPQTSNTFQLLVHDCREIITEYSFTSRWAIIEMYHALGKRLYDEKELTHESVASVAKALGRPVRNFQRSLQFYKKYPDLTLLPEGKNTSWSEIVNKYLPVTVKEKEAKFIECPNCGVKIQVN